MNKITKIEITITNIITDLENRPDPITETIKLCRNDEKIWYIKSDYTSRKGLFPNEIRLANLLQDIIQKYNHGIKDNQ